MYTFITTIWYNKYRQTDFTTLSIQENNPPPKHLIHRINPAITYKNPSESRT